MLSDFMKCELVLILIVFLVYLRSLNILLKRLSMITKSISSVSNKTPNLNWSKQLIGNMYGW